MKESILNQYELSRSLFERLGIKCKGILSDLIKHQDLNIHQITFRIKTKESISRKIEIKKNKYADINEITDVCGIRIITYLESDVYRVAEIIEKEFKVDKGNSLDKRNLNFDQFGYMSLHLVVSLNDSRQVLTEYAQLKDLKVEIQIRSILQHAWAEIEHDLGYKGTFAIPEKVKRNFNRLAALLETADIEFDRLKRDLNVYEERVHKDIISKPNEVLLDQASISFFVTSDKTFVSARNIIANNTKCKYYDREDFTGELERFPLFNIKSIGELEKKVKENENHFLAFVDSFTKDIREPELNSALPLFYFQHFLACSTNKEDFVVNYFQHGSRRIGGNINVAKDYIKIYNETK